MIFICLNTESSLKKIIFFIKRPQHPPLFLGVKKLHILCFEFLFYILHLYCLYLTFYFTFPVEQFVHPMRHLLRPFNHLHDDDHPSQWWSPPCPRSRQPLLSAGAEDCWIYSQSQSPLFFIWSRHWSSEVDVGDRSVSKYYRVRNFNHLYEDGVGK